MTATTPQEATSSQSDYGDPVLEVRNVSKYFGHVTALSDVSLAIYPGKVTALCGDNGAGKSTLVGVLTGLLHPDEGSVYLHGEPVKLQDPAKAQSLGIATVFQDLAMVSQRDVAANVFAGRELVRGRFFLDRRAMLQETTKLISNMKVGLPSARTKVSELSGGQRQAAAIVRTLLDKNAATLLDEPTAALGVRESARVLELITRLKDSGQAVCLITHNMESVFEICDRVAVMRLGRLRAVYDVKDITRDQIVGLLTGAVDEIPMMNGGAV
jgi:D-xylose transport system ATP-binding protein